MSAIVERIARAICESVGPEGSSDARSQMGDWPAWHDWVPQARAALRSVRPEDVTDAMVEAACWAIHPAKWCKKRENEMRRAIAAAIAKGAE